MAGSVGTHLLGQDCPSQVAVSVFRNANLLILDSFWSFLPCLSYLINQPHRLHLPPAFTLSGLHAQDLPVPHNLTWHPKRQVDSILKKSSILENRQSIFRRRRHRWKETRCVRTGSERQGCEPSSHTHNVSHRRAQRETSA